MEVCIKKYSRGFTLIEILVVIAIVGVLSGVVFTALMKGRAKARDAQRKQDLHHARVALALYYDTFGNWVETGSGCGDSGNGTGFFSYVGGPLYTKSISQCLLENGFTSAEIVDPSGGRGGSTPTNNTYNYMKYHCNNPRQVYLYAKMETIPQSGTATDGTCCTGCDTSYGMNYYLKVQ